jgi:hypothetical protein
MTRIKLFLAMFLFVQGVVVYATAQLPDYLIYGEGKYALATNPMEAYFEKFPKKRPRPIMTALWRGYAATFEIMQNELWVVNIDAFGPGNITDQCLDGKDRIKVDWFSGVLVMPHGELLHYVHLGYESIYEYYKLIEIERGNFVRELNLNYEEYVKYKTARSSGYEREKTS